VGPMFVEILIFVVGSRLTAGTTLKRIRPYGGRP
jgi:hypothetical protein